jgi:mannose-6-phosphate isomerase-like protein (cupin superfamily)
VGETLRRIPFAIVAALACNLPFAIAQNGAGSLPEPLSPHLGDGATVYVLESNGYTLARKGSNGFTCLLHRDHPMNSKPTCWDREGTETIVPAVLREGQLLMQGKTVAEVRAAIKRGFDAGTFIAPRRPGVAYMLSNENRNYTGRTGQVGYFSAARDILRAEPDRRRYRVYGRWRRRAAVYRLPGGPHGYMISIVPAPEPTTTMTTIPPAAEVFHLDELRANRERSGKEYLPFFKAPSMRMGVYALAAGADDTQSPHEEDEVYYVVRWRAVLQVDSKDYPVQAGSLVFVAAQMVHKFHSIQEPLETLVFFSAVPAPH